MASNSLELVGLDLSEGKFKTVLRSMGLTETEVEIYLFLSKNCPCKGTYVAKQLHKDKAQVYHVLKTLQAKGLAESTLESPVRYSPVSLEKIIDSTIKMKREEAAEIENTKRVLIKYWKGLKKNTDDLTSEKFVTIENSNKILNKLLQMVDDTKVEFSSFLSTKGLSEVHRLGFFEVIQEKSRNPSKNFRILVELDEKNVNLLKVLLKSKPKNNLDMRGKTPDLTGRSPPKMAIRDDEELLVFVKSASGIGEREKKDLCFWTDNRVLVQSFMSLFRSIWQIAESVEDKIKEVETNQISPKIVSLKNSDRLKKTYHSILESLKEEIIIVTTQEEFIASFSNLALLEDWIHKGITVKIMISTITKEFAPPLSLPPIRIQRIPPGHPQTVLVDCKHLFQSRSVIPSTEEFEFFSHFNSAVYSNDFRHLEKIKKSLDTLWLDSLSQKNDRAIEGSVSAQIVPTKKIRYTEYKKMIGAQRRDVGVLSENELIQKIVTAKRTVTKNWEDTITWYGSRAIAIVHPPDFMKLSDIVLTIYNANKLSSFGEEDFMIVNMWNETAHTYLPVAVLTDNNRGVAIRKRAWINSAAAQNFQCVRKNQFQIQVQGNTLFAGWTVPIKVGPGSLALPPACILFEGYGQVISGIERSKLPSGRKVVSEYNSFEAKATFYHPASEYSAAGTDGLFSREIIVTSTPPT